MPTLVWKSDTLNGREHYSSQMVRVSFPGVSNITYYASWDWRGTLKPQALKVVGPRGGLRFINLGKCTTITEAKSICEQHYADGGRLTGAWRRRRLESDESGCRPWDDPRVTA
jgi:hypothetical protein